MSKRSYQTFLGNVPSLESSSKKVQNENNQTQPMSSETNPVVNEMVVPISAESSVNPPAFQIFYRQGFILHVEKIDVVPREEEEIEQFDDEEEFEGDYISEDEEGDYSVMKSVTELIRSRNENVDPEDDGWSPRVEFLDEYPETDEEDTDPDYYSDSDYSSEIDDRPRQKKT